MNVYYIDEILLTLLEMKRKGYNYCEISELDSDDEECSPSCLYCNAINCLGLVAINYKYIDCVPVNEFLEYADQDAGFPMHRPTIVSFDMEVVNEHE